jgi:hypothetical protein
MVTILKTYNRRKIVDVTLNMQDIYDIINGLNILVGNKEDEMNKHSGGDSIDISQYERYKQLLREFQQVKGLFK